MDLERKNKEKVETRKTNNNKFLIRVLEPGTLDLNTPNSELMTPNFLEAGMAERFFNILDFKGHSIEFTRFPL
jgi:hypothetical protein